METIRPPAARNWIIVSLTGHAVAPRRTVVFRGTVLGRAVVVLVIGAGFLLGGVAVAFAQCAMCEGASAAGADGGAVYNRSTLFMLSVPYLLLAGVAGYVAYAFRRARPVAPPTPTESPVSEVPSTEPASPEET